MSLIDRLLSLVSAFATDIEAAHSRLDGLVKMMPDKATAITSSNGDPSGYYCYPGGVVRGGVVCNGGLMLGGQRHNILHAGEPVFAVPDPYWANVVLLLDKGTNGHNIAPSGVGLYLFNQIVGWSPDYSDGLLFPADNDQASNKMRFWRLYDHREILKVGHADWTIECEIALSDADYNATGRPSPFLPILGANASGYAITSATLQAGGAPPPVYVCWRSGGAYPNMVSIPNLPKSCYLAVSKNGDTYRAYIDGVLVATNTNALTSIPDDYWDWAGAAAGNIRMFSLGYQGSIAAGILRGSRIKRVRITTGVARYTGATHDIPAVWPRTAETYTPIEYAQIGPDQYFVPYYNNASADKLSASLTYAMTSVPTGNRFLFGGRQVAGDATQIGINCAAATLTGYYGSSTLSMGTVVAGQKLTLSVVEGQWYVDGVAVGATLTRSNTTQVVVLGSMATGNALFANTAGSNLRIYAFEIREGATVKCSLVPRRRDRDGAVGLLDTVTGQFLLPNGTAIAP